MTREKQIKAALDVLEPPAHKREQCRGNVEYMLDEVAAAFRSAEQHSAKDVTRAWDRYHLALRNLRAGHNALEAVGWRGLIEAGEIERAFEASTPEAIERRKHSAKVFMSFGGSAQERAAECAHELLVQWCGSGKIATTRKGKLWRLAAILFGDPNADLFRYLRVFAHKPPTWDWGQSS